MTTWAEVLTVVDEEMSGGTMRTLVSLVAGGIELGDVFVAVGTRAEELTKLGFGLRIERCWVGLPKHGQLFTLLLQHLDVLLVGKFLGRFGLLKQRRLCRLEKMAKLFNADLDTSSVDREWKQVANDG